MREIPSLWLRVGADLVLIYLLLSMMLPLVTGLRLWPIGLLVALFVWDAVTLARAIRRKRAT